MRKRGLAWLLACVLFAGTAAEPFDTLQVSAEVTQTEPAEEQEETEEHEAPEKMKLETEQTVEQAVYGQTRASEDLKYGNFSYQVLDDGTVEITDYPETGTDTTVIIPAEIDGRKVANIGDGAFFDCSRLEKIELPESVASIDNMK